MLPSRCNNLAWPIMSTSGCRSPARNFSDSAAGMVSYSNIPITHYMSLAWRNSVVQGEEAGELFLLSRQGHRHSPSGVTALNRRWRAPQRLSCCIKELTQSSALTDVPEHPLCIMLPILLRLWWWTNSWNLPTCAFLDADIRHSHYVRVVTYFSQKKEVCETLQDIHASSVLATESLEQKPWPLRWSLFRKSWTSPWISFSFFFHNGKTVLKWPIMVIFWGCDGNTRSSIWYK